MGRFTFKVEINEKGEVVMVEPPVGTSLRCSGIDVASSPEKAKMEKVKQPIEIEQIQLYIFADEDPCVRVGNVLWCW